jgi:hypothetical protein
VVPAAAAVAPAAAAVAAKAHDVAADSAAPPKELSAMQLQLKEFLLAALAKGGVSVSVVDAMLSKLTSEKVMCNSTEALLDLHSEDLVRADCPR